MAALPTRRPLHSAHWCVTPPPHRRLPAWETHLTAPRPRLCEHVHRSAPSHTGRERDVTPVPGAGRPRFKLAPVLPLDSARPSGGGRPPRGQRRASQCPQRGCSGSHSVSVIGVSLPPPKTAHKDPRMEKGPRGEEGTEVTPGGLGAPRRSAAGAPPRRRAWSRPEPASAPPPAGPPRRCPRWRGVGQSHVRFLLCV